MKVRVHHFLIDLDSKPKEELRKTVRWRHQQRKPVNNTAKKDFPEYSPWQPLWKIVLIKLS